MYKTLLLHILLVGSSLASPVPQTDEGMKEGSKAVFSLLSQVASVVQKTGDVIAQLSKNYTDMPELEQTGESISKVGEDFPGQLNDMVQDNFQMLLQMIPSVKHNITEAMDQLPGFKTQISDNIDMLPSKDQIKENVEPLFEVLGLFVDDEDLDDLRSKVEDHVDSLPSKDYIDENIQQALDSIPSADYMHDKVDEFVDQVAPIVEELNETGGSK